MGRPAAAGLEGARSLGDPCPRSAAACTAAVLARAGEDAGFHQLRRKVAKCASENASTAIVQTDRLFRRDTAVTLASPAFVRM